MTPRTRPRRRSALLAGVIAAVTGFATAVVLPAGSAEAATGLAALAAAKGRFFGTATDAPELSDTAYTSILTGGEFNQLTPGNRLKWQFTEPVQGQFDFAEADREVNLGLANRMKVRGHTLVWHSQLAGWVNALPSDQVQAAMEHHITAEVSHFKRRIFAWDVVNEPFNEDGTFRASVFSNAMGSGYIAHALRTAHAADPRAKLYLNDYNIEGTNPKSDAMYNLAKSLLAQGLPLHGIGIQGHLAVQYGFPANMAANLQRFADLGLDVSITELDVRMPLPETAEKDATQDRYYHDVVSACMAVRRCVGVTLWDFTDKYSWVPAFFPGQGAPLPWDENLVKKPHVYDAIVDALCTRPAPLPAGS
jgi:endo-1,4-beta-xylanase